MSPKCSQIQDLIEWGRLHRSNLHSNIEIYQDPVTGLSFRARSDHASGSTVVTSSHRISLSFLNAIEESGFHRHCEPFPVQFLKPLSEDDPNIIGHFFLVQQYLKREASFWWPYIRLLPQIDQPQSLGIPIWWPREDRRFLDGTNAEPPLQKRKQLWHAEWSKGIALLQDHFANWQDYSFVLYQWAATIFGSRSFRASLTVQESMLQDPLTLDHVRKDRFSVLLPVLDIGNHNGLNNIDWISDQEGLSLAVRKAVPAGEQIFNYYGNKSNSELLVAYGFTLPVKKGPSIDRDVVNLKLKPSSEALSLRRSQTCHAVPRVAEEEYTFMVHKQAFRQSGLPDFSVFSDGLIDLIICMVANNREKRYILANSGYCPEKDANLMDGLLSRSALHVLNVLFSKISMEQRRIQDSGSDLPEPTNDNQRLALDYRQRQLCVLSAASLKIKKRLDRVLTFSSFCQHASHTASGGADYEELALSHQSAELLSLECAFDWLNLHYPDLFNAIVSMISEDQEESLPLNWAILVDDWDHTYWTVWIFTVWLLWAREGQAFRFRHSNLSTWLLLMNEAFDFELASDGSTDVLYADASEVGTINRMVEGISRLSQIGDRELREWLAKPTSIIRLRNFASFVAQEETFTVRFEMQDSAKTTAEQRVLCIGNGTGTEEQRVNGTWTAFFRGAIGPRESDPRP